MWYVNSPRLESRKRGFKVSSRKVFKKGDTIGVHQDSQLEPAERGIFFASLKRSLNENRAITT